MTPLALIFLTVHLAAATPVDVLHSLERYPGRSSLSKTLHVECQESRIDKSKSPTKQALFDLGIQIMNGELRVQQSLHPNETTELEIRQILDPLPLIESWLSNDTLAVTSQNADHLEFKVPPKVPSRLKRLWESEGHLEVWLANDGSPSRARLVQRYKGRIQRIAPTEEVKILTDFIFKSEGDHLLIARLEESRDEMYGYEVKKRHRVLELRN